MKLFLTFLIGLLPQILAAQTLHKWVDEQGNVSYSDRPPPSGLAVKDVSDTLNTMGAGAASSDAGYELKQLMKQSPIVIYTFKGCAPCDQGRTLLVGKGYPFSEKTIGSNADLGALQTQFGSQTLPVLTVGKTVLNGYGQPQWEDALSTAGYNSVTVLPPNASNGLATSLTANPAPSQPAVAAPTPSVSPAQSPAKP